MAAVWALLVGNKFPFSHEQQLTASAATNSTEPDISRQVAGRHRSNETGRAGELATVLRSMKRHVEMVIIASALRPLVGMSALHFPSPQLPLLMHLEKMGVIFS